ncbi:hypothetical protein EMCRGX_G018890 [Ephydatia muelleri]
MMKHRSVVLIILAALLREAVSLTCPPNYRPNSSTRCLYIVNNQTAAATSASCGSNFLVDVQDQLQYANLKLYLQVQGTPNSAYWTRYSFSAPSAFSTIVSNSTNFNGTSNVSSGQCVAIQQQGLFVVASCSTNLPFICVSDTQAQTTPTALLSTAPLHFQKDDVTINTTSVSLMASPTQLNLTLASVQAGRYDCVASNPLGAVKSTAIVVTASSGSTTVIGPITVMFNGVATSTPMPLPLGTSFNLSCSSTSSGLRWTWFRNGAPLNSSSSSVDVNDFNTYDTSGFYQCRALDPTSNSNAMGQLLILATDGVSGPVDSVVTSPSSQTGVVVNWAPPSSPNTDQSLLRYTVTWCDSSSSPLCNTSSGVAPVASPDPSLGISTPFTGQMAISQLQPGSLYMVQVGVASPMGGLVAPLYNVSTQTFGTVPNATVQIFNVSRTQDNTTIVAYWQPLETTPPAGRVARYYVEYRDASKGTSNVVYVSSAYNYIVLQNLLDANNYEVRVQAAVRISSSDFGKTAPSNWTFSSGVTRVVPSMPPTGSVQGAVDAGVVAPAVILPVFAVAVAVTAITVPIWFVLKKSKSVDTVDAPGVLDTELMSQDLEMDKKPMLND